MDTVLQADAGVRQSLSVIRLEIQESGDDFVLRWFLTGPVDSGSISKWPKYRVAKLAVDTAAKRVRAALERFATACVDMQLAQQVPLLEDLVLTGQALYEVMMTPNEERPSEFRAWFEKSVVRIDEPAADPGYAVEVVLAPTTISEGVPPFGLMFTPRRNRPVPQSIDFDQYMDFWCVSLRTACFTEVQLLSKVEQPVEGDQFDTVIVREHADQAYLLVENIIKAENKTLAIAEKQETDGTNLGAKLAQVYGGKGILFHFDLHSTHPGTEVNLSFDENNRSRLSAAQFKQIIKDAKRRAGEGRVNPLDLAESWRPTYALAVVDREALIRGDRGQEWLEIFFSTPWIGLIAVEGDVKSAREDWNEEEQVRPDRFLGLVFLRSILKRNGRRMLDSIVEARRETWPFSLFYGLYCNPHQPWITDQPALVNDVDVLIPLLGPHHPARDCGIASN